MPYSSSRPALAICVVERVSVLVKMEERTVRRFIVVLELEVIDPSFLFAALAYSAEFRRDNEEDGTELEEKADALLPQVTARARA